MRTTGLFAAALLAVAVAGCNPSLVKKGDPLYAYVQQKSYYLARPLSGPRWRNPNVFGAPPVIAAGTKVTVTGIERVTPIYRVDFTGPSACKPTCETHWREPDDKAFKGKFEAVFSEKDPLAAEDPQMKDLIGKHQVASSMTATQLLLSIGTPNRVEKKDGVIKWIYERRACDATGRLLAMPKLALDFKGGKLTNFEELDSSKWYVTREPVGRLTSLCEGVKELPGDVQTRPAQAGEDIGSAVPDTPGNSDMGGGTSSGSPSSRGSNGPSPGM